MSNPGCGSQSVCTFDEGGVPPFMVECAVNQSACPLQCKDQLSMASLCVMGAPSVVTFPDSTIFRRSGCVNANYKDGQGNLVEVLEEDFTCQYTWKEMV